MKMLIKLLVNLLVSALAIFLTARLLPGVHVTGNWQTYLWLALALGLVNFFIRPVLGLLTLPLSIITLGLFSLVLNAALVLLVAHYVPGLTLDSFLDAVYFGIVLSVVHGILHVLEK